MRRGFSVVEVVLAAGVFTVFVSGAVTALISGWYGNRQGADTAMAVEYASEGLEAARSIRNQGFASLADTNQTGITRDGSGVWIFAGTNNTTDSGRMRRTLSVSAVNRDGTGNIVPAPTGTIDADTKRVTATVNWNLTATRPQEVLVSTYLTNWKAAIGTTGGLLWYGDVATTPRYRLYDQTGNSFGVENSGPVGAAGRNFVIKASPTKHEAVAGYTDATGNLRVMCFDGTSWFAEWGPVSVGGTGNTRRFDIGFETSSGDVMVLYSTNAGSNELEYRVKPGTAECGGANWSAPAAFDSPGTNGIVQWVKMSSDRRGFSDVMAAIWADANSDLQAAMWNGSSWVQRGTALETSLEVVSAAQDVDDFEVEFESLSGEVMVVWANSAGSNGTNGVRYATCTPAGANCTWSEVLTPPTWTDDATNLDISANPVDNQIIFASVGNAGSDLQIGRWDGSTWVNIANRDVSCTSPGQYTQLVATGWLINGGQARGVVMYPDNNSTVVNYQIMTPGNPPSWTATANWSPTPLLNRVRYWHNIQTDPANRQFLMLTISDTSGGNRLFAKRLEMTAAGVMTWTNSDGGTALETALGQATSSPFSFAYWIK